MTGVSHVFELRSHKIKLNCHISLCNDTVLPTMKRVGVNLNINRSFNFLWFFCCQALVLCFRLHFTKDSTTTNTAAATIRQIVSVVFERVVTEDSEPAAGR